MRFIAIVIPFLFSLLGYSQNGTINVNGQVVRYFVDYDSSNSNTLSWARASDGVDRFKNNAAYPQATHLYNATNAVSGNIINTQGEMIKHLYAIGVTGKGVKIGMIDYQFSEYPGLTFSGGRGSLITTPSPTITEHGTTMSSIIGEKPNGYGGLVKPNGIVGIAYEAQLYHYQYTDIVTEVQACIDDKMDIINIPLNLGVNSAITAKIQQAIQKGIYVIVASGNSAYNNALSNITYPASVRGVFSVTGRVGGLVFAEDSTRIYSSVLPSTVTGLSKSLDFGIPAWTIGKDNAYGRGWTAHVGASEACSIMSGYVALMLDYYKSKFGIKLKPFQALNYFKKHTITTGFFGYFQDLDFLSPGNENAPAPAYIPLPPIVTPPSGSSFTAAVTADFERLTGSTASASGLGGQLTMSRAAVSGDIGKNVVVKEARSYLNYRQAPLSWNGKITGVSAGIATITSIIGDTLINVTDKEVLIGTNNFDTIQYALNYCAANGIDTLKFDFTGTAYVVPQYSRNAPSNPHDANSFWGLTSTSNIVVKGNGSDATILKFGTEDNVSTGQNTAFIYYNGEYEYAGFVYGNNSTLELNALNIESADRVTLRTYTNITAVRSKFIGNDHKGFTMKNAKITAGSGGLDNGWPLGFYSSLGGDNTFRVYNRFYNSKIVSRIPVTIYSGNGAYKDYYVRNLHLVGGGSKEYRPLVTNAASITSGSNVLTVANNPNFSFYDCNSYEPLFTLPALLIDGTFKARVVSITSPTTAILDQVAPSTFTNASIQLFGRGRSGESHTQYIHPNVNLDVDSLTVDSTLKLGMHYYSGGGVTGNISKRDVKHLTINTTYPAGYPVVASNLLLTEWVNAGLQTENSNNASGIPYVLENSNVYLYSNVGVDMNIVTSNIQGGQFGGGIVYKSTGIFDSRSNTTLYMDSIEGSQINISYVDSSVRNRKSILNSGNTSRLSQVNIISCDDTLIVRNSKMTDLYFYKGCINTNSRYTFENIDIRGGFGWSFFYATPQVAWTTEEKQQFIAQSSFSGCTCSAGVYAGMDPLIRPFFTVN